MKLTPHKPRVVPPKLGRAYVRLWKVVDGAVVDTLNTHPYYVANEELVNYLRLSLNKRIVGRVLGSYAEMRGAIVKDADRPIREALDR